MSIRKTYLRNKGYIRENGNIKHTKVTMFCLPMYGIHYKDFGNHLLNVHTIQEDNPYLYVLILNPYKEDPHLNKVLDKLRNHYNFVEETRDDEDYEIVIKMKLDSHWEDDYYKIMSGDYSQLSEDYKKILINLFSDRKEDLTKPPKIIDGQVLTTMHEVLYPTIEKKKVIAKHFGVEVSSVKELISKPDIRYELYRKTSELLNEEEAV